MNHRIVGFHQDEHQDWVAELDCGHNQHVRHDPPFQTRPWCSPLRAVTAGSGSNSPARNATKAPRVITKSTENQSVALSAVARAEP